MLDYYFGCVKEVKGEDIVVVDSPEFRVSNLEVVLPELMSRRPSVGDTIQFVYSYDSRGVRFGLFFRYDNEKTTYLNEIQAPSNV